MTTHRYTVPGAPSRGDRDVLVARLWACGALGVWEQDHATVAWFDAPTDDVPGGGEWSVEEDRDWLAEWKKDLGVVRVGTVAIVPTWLEYEPYPSDVTLWIDPEQAFGTGHHATTRRCLELLQDDALTLDGAEVLDVGTGTGVLASVCARFGAPKVIGVDIDPTAIECAVANAERNEVDLDLRVGTVGAELGTFDLVIANLVTAVILDLAPDLVAATRPAGHLVLSGIRAERGDEVVAALDVAGVDVLRRVEEDDWLALLAQRRPRPS